ncbi:cysteine-rich small domain-containing protein [Methanocaldococcus indicus]|uniref:cysteine-rich small domain-containing protein n=1 Tax=Methanocaldococcus indicus TaxID=213231 RepID=UPI003C6D9587
MIELAKNHFKKVILLNINRKCQYYPCHFDGQTCLWCFCPFYPCEDEDLGEYIERKDGTKIWSCMNCLWIHRVDVSTEILKEILYLIKDKDLDTAINIFEDRELLLKIKEKVKEKYPNNVVEG